jgi:hypothetical protein
MDTPAGGSTIAIPLPADAVPLAHRRDSPVDRANGSADGNYHQAETLK